MFKASNNHFIHRSKIKIPKIRPFYNLKSTKITKNVEKYFQHQFWKILHAQNIKKKVDAVEDCNILLIVVTILLGQ